MGGRRPVNQHFFDQESKAMYYVLGAFYAGCLLTEEDCVIFRSSNKDLVQVIKDQLGSDHKIIPTPGEVSYRLEMKTVHMYSKLEELGLRMPKSERTFPNIGEEDISHFVRGFFDAKAHIRVNNGKISTISVWFNNSFLEALNKVLVQYTGVEHNKKINDVVRYGQENSLNIYSFIYSDWDYIKEHGLYLPSKKELFVAEHSFRHPNVVAASERVKEAKKLLLADMKVYEAAKRLGYTHYNSLCRAFIRATGRTITEFLKESSIGH